MVIDGRGAGDWDTMLVAKLAIGGGDGEDKVGVGFEA